MSLKSYVDLAWEEGSELTMASRELEAVFFDLDGVLIDSEPAWDAARRAVVAEAGGQWQPGATEAMLGMSAPEWSRYMHDQLAVPLEADEINERAVAHLLDTYKRRLPLLPGAVEAVRRLGKKWPLGLATSSNREVIDAVLSSSGMTERFSTTVSGDEVSYGKPAPDIYLAAARDLEVDPSRSVAVEDSTNGLRAAAAAGMMVAAIPNREFPPAQEALALAEVVVKSLDKLTPQALLFP